MTDSYRDLHDDAYREWREHRADEFVAIQRRSFKAGFEAAASESQNFNHLRTWLEEQRDDAKQQLDGDNGDHLDRMRYLTFVDVLVKLSEMGCDPHE